MNSAHHHTRHVKKGNAALSWALVMVMALAMIAMVISPMREGVADTSTTIVTEMDEMMDTIDEKVINYADN